MSGFANPTGVVPASLSFFTIYNPSLGASDESVQDQIVYYFKALKDGLQSRKKIDFQEVNESQEETNRRLREIGLAQATVQFATFWEPFLRNWDVLLHGNPAVDIHNGIKLSAGGELGIGVGEEEWGSGEREVLEGFVQRTDGLVDLVISRFDHSRRNGAPLAPLPSASPCLINGDVTKPSDGIIFSGVGSLTKESLRNVSAWMEWLAIFGTECYGVRQNPNVDTRRRPVRKDRSQDAKSRGVQKHEQTTLESKAHTDQGDEPGEIGIPAPIVRPQGLPQTSLGNPTKKPSGYIRNFDKQQNEPSEDSALGAEIVKYLTLGVYGSAWGMRAGRPPVDNPCAESPKPKPTAPLDSPRASTKSKESSGFFLIGLLGDVEDDAKDEDAAENTASKENIQAKSEGRLLMRNLHVERTKETSSHSNESGSSGPHALQQTYHDRLRVVVYVQAPFLFTFLFETRTDTLALPFFYRSLHHQLGPLRRPLLKSTDPAMVTQRLWETANPRSTSQARNGRLIQDLVYDPNRLTIHASIPNIPEPASDLGDLGTDWSRVEALGVHSQILNTYVASRQQSSEIERTCKTSRGWWVVWMRLPHSSGASSECQEGYREAVLIRRANDTNGNKARQSSSGFGFGFNRGGEKAGGWQSKISDGIGIDARQYIEGLLSLSR
ncbi:uncharacterized protein KY384_006977 [Bacidia gigantensis]|uniref:uncharacterized protein n=1 Tax=Bacidia gigantensis TaxID=2732470 RepID=UPI001D049223|nr:uncharacterized protein KY384_006977 [Bacidia gigantensis]KAG8528061.1 hypothetical protein KY384_006977 [Bacidia gigantensis]